MTNAEQVSGVRDEHYAVVSILYHALQGAETYQTYINDAERAGDQELVQFFREVQEEERRRGLALRSCCEAGSPRDSCPGIATEEEKL